MSYTGRVNNIIYENEDFKIIKVLLDNSADSFPIVVKGNFPGKALEIGSWVSFEAKEVEDAKYGKQLSVTKFPAPVKNWDENRIISALTAQGVGMVSRDKLLRYTRQNKVSLYDLLNSGDLSNLEDLQPFVQEHIISRWKSLRMQLEAVNFLYDSGLPPAVIAKVWKTLGTDLEDKILEDPWLLVRVAGISFKEADEVAQKLGVPLDSTQRVKGAVLSSIKEGTAHGDVYMNTGPLVDEVKKLLGGNVDAKKIADSILKLSEQKLIVADRQDGIVCVYPKANYQMETFCAEKLSERGKLSVDEQWLSKCYSRVGHTIETLAKNGSPLEDVAKETLNNWAKGKKIELTPQQMGACLNILTSRISIVTGLPGTGKTTSLRATVGILKDAGIPFLLAAPTGIAAKRLSSVTGYEASTVHRAFGAKGFAKEEEEQESSYIGIIKTGKKSGGEDRSNEEWGFDENNPHPAKFVIIDESSMLDLHMLYRLLLGTSSDCSLVFVGDPFQLPSVGSGDVLRDLVSSKQFAHTHLDEIFRQEETSGIVIAAHKSHAGKMPDVSGEDFKLIDARSENDAGDKIVQIAHKLYDKRINFQILSPRHAGDAGVTALNSALRTSLNPASPGVHEIRLGSALIREGDRVMVVQNDYSKGVYNGDVGKVSYIDKKAKEIEIKIHEGVGLPPSIIRYEFKDASQALRLAYAQTVHKSQGQEYDVIVIPVLDSFGFQLQRNLFYTAITRAKKRVFLVGTESAIQKAVTNNQSNNRKTLLSKRIQGFSQP